MSDWTRIRHVTMVTQGQLSITPHLHGGSICAWSRTWEETWTAYCTAMLEGDPTLADTLLRELTDR